MKGFLHDRVVGRAGIVGTDIRVDSQEGRVATLDRRVTESVAYRDAGDVERAKALLEEIVLEAPEHFGATLELLVIMTMTDTADLPDWLVGQMPVELRSHPHIRLIIACNLIRNRRTKDAIEWMAGVTAESVASVPTFSSFRRNALIQLARQSFDLTKPLADVLPSPRMEEARTALAELFLQEAINSQDNADELFESLKLLTFLQPDCLHCRFDFFSGLLIRLPDHTPSVLLATAFAYSVSTRRWNEARLLLDRILCRPDHVQDPVFARALVTFATEGDRNLLPVATRVLDECSAWLGTNDLPAGSRAIAYLNGLEVRARQFRQEIRPASVFAEIGALAPTYRARPAADGLHIYSGFFGQLRFGKYLLGPISAYLETELACLANMGARLSQGVSTWESVGQRELQEEDGYPFLDCLIPEVIAQQLSDRRLAIVREAMPLIPNIARTILQESREIETIDQQSLLSVCRAETQVDVASDGHFMSDLGNRLVETLGDFTSLLNQGRMWNRIAAHRQLVEKAEQAAGRPVTHVVMMRSDLTNLSGPLGRYLRDRILSGGTNWAMFDHDSHATYIDGVGDRFMLMDREAFERLLDGYDLLKSIVAEGTCVDPAYRVRYSAHAHLRTVMFEHGTEVHEILRSSIGFDIFRGRRTIAHLAEEIANDAVESIDPVMREFLAGLVQPPASAD
jgi:hypothetical protein